MDFSKALHKARHATGGPDAIAPDDIGLGSVDNTADSAKPVSTAQADAIAAKITPAGVDTKIASEHDAERAHQSSTYAGVAKFTGTTYGGTRGAFLKPVRVPTLTVERAWPAVDSDLNILWASMDGVTIYAVAGDNTIRKSVDGGAKWTRKGNVPAASAGVASRAVVGGQNSFLKTAAGVLLSFRMTETGLVDLIVRSTDDGVTWTEITGTPFTTAGHPMSGTSWCIDPVTNYIYWGEYCDNTTVVNLFRSTDDGATWTVFATFPGISSSDPLKIRHIHAVRWDHVTSRIVIMCGDDTAAAGIYRIDAAGTGVEPWLLNSQITNLNDGAGALTNCARAISFIPFADYIVYAGDSGANPWLCRVQRTDLTTDGTTITPVERIYQFNSTGWFATQAADDGSRWVVCASQESNSLLIDNAVHLYAVEDQGATVYEVGALAPRATTVGALVSLAVLGSATAGGDVFFLKGSNTGGSPVWKMRLAYGAGAQIPWPTLSVPSRAYLWQQANSGYCLLAASEDRTFHVVKIPTGAKYLRIYDMGAKTLTGGTTYIKCQITTAAGTNLQGPTTAISDRDAIKAMGDTDQLYDFALTIGTEVRFHILNSSSTTEFNGTAFVTYGFSATP